MSNHQSPDFSSRAVHHFFFLPPPPSHPVALKKLSLGGTNPPSKSTPGRENIFWITREFASDILEPWTVETPVTEEEIDGKKGVVQVAGVNVGFVRDEHARKRDTVRDVKGKEPAMWLFYTYTVDPLEKQRWIESIKNKVFVLRTIRAALGSSLPSSEMNPTARCIQLFCWKWARNLACCISNDS
ncbi:hypothetical protein BT96DRAFT_950853 [Gymnopus androsaceus JB14]|uniref:Uncharacterized protein n=1 Tax=Gymnopus androsaceus JB14 TaxID=1447944 RepID=A0A6A4GF87_9AGAR|nr:hypothetical protein BT96DRAFT_950853 [Gymnopus androsaceus JB14]